ncbi:hypothetical protein ACP_0397 [Acidobacterium capsulatum ATCC 51196]|uniref:Uncharacterized protein n=1 Tax=Acidobacterium capsulatum (strain ATCC 51196 / DSM 11244 / BCRC 80197 / JCM 7670 / NBRC 15755 / NCIMB 13165 / 161) TaxID=240015 RepID=C1FA17_ACIC5|nr:hypothetical protein ACP_0397 [Acidobacterium capsulatum ATCC 51196]
MRSCRSSLSPWPAPLAKVASSSSEIRSVIAIVLGRTAAQASHPVEFSRKAELAHWLRPQILSHAKSGLLVDGRDSIDRLHVVILGQRRALPDLRHVNADQTSSADLGFRDAAGNTVVPEKLNERPHLFLVLVHRLPLSFLLPGGSVAG